MVFTVEHEPCRRISWAWIEQTQIHEIRPIFDDNHLSQAFLMVDSRDEILFGMNGWGKFEIGRQRYTPVVDSAESLHLAGARFLVQTLLYFSPRSL